MLAGGGALLRGLDTLLSHETGIVTHIAEDPLRCVVKGTGEVLKNPKILDRVLRESSRLI
jgi:rod shape-determining protein MreB